MAVNRHSFSNGIMLDVGCVCFILEMILERQEFVYDQFFKNQETHPKQFQ